MRTTRAMRFLIALIALSFVSTTEMHAQSCVGPAPDQTCTVSTNLTGNSLIVTPLGPSPAGNATGIVTGSGVIDDTMVSAESGNATTRNSGTVINSIDTSTSDGGAALSVNSGDVTSIFTSTTVTTALFSGSATTVNSGNVFGSISTSSDGGGSATSINSGSVLGFILAQTSNGGFGFGAGTATSINSGTATAIINQTFDGGNSVVFNSGTLSGNFGPAGIYNQVMQNGAATTINSGTVNNGIYTVTGVSNGFGGDATTINYGKVNGDVVSGAAANGVGGPGNATVVNYGSIDTSTGLFGAVQAASLTGIAHAYNAGRIYGELDAFAGPGGQAIVSNAGLIDGSLFGTAIDLGQAFGALIPTTLNILPGSRIIGNVYLNGDVSIPGSGTQVNIFGGADISSTIKFGGGCICGSGGILDTGATINVFGGAPYVIFRDTVSVLDPTSFALQDRNITEFSHTISSMVTSRLNNPAPISGGSSVSGFAPSGSVAADMARDAFAGISSLNYASSDRVLFSNPSMTAADGTSVWAQGFAGQRIQDASAPVLRSVNNFYGGMLGIDKAVRPDLRIGGLIGAGSIKSTIELNSGDTTSDIVFGGVYGRYAMNRSFLDFALIGGYGSNDLRRNMANNLAPNGLETATATYASWFISPEIAYGVKMPMGNNLTLTPTARVRYLAAGFGGYDESGSTTNLSVASRTSHNFEERGELTLTRTSDPVPTQRMQVSGTLGGLALQRAGDTTVNTILLGQNLPFATPGKNDVFGIYSGVGFDWRNRNGVTVFGAAEYTAMTDSSRTATAKGGVRVVF